VNILLLNQFFYPDPAPTGQLAADLARHLTAQGHSVTVVCARPSYGSPAPDTAALEVIRVLHTPAFRFSRSHAARLASWLSFYAGAAWRGLRARPDIVVAMTTPPLLPLIGTLLKKLRKSRHFIWEMDVYPDVAVALGVLSPRSLLTRATSALAGYSRRHADGIIALGPCMRDRLIARGVPASKIHVADNWADGSQIRPRPLPKTPPFTVLYSGNLGLAHDIETIATAMRRLASDDTVRFVFAGAGSRRKVLENLCHASLITRVSFLGYQEASRLCDHLAGCHIGLVTQNLATLGCVVPSKTYALMAAARPILFIGPRDATPALIIERFRCGWQIDPGDSDALVSLLHLLAADPDLARQAGDRARQAFLDHYDLPIGIERICSILGIPSRPPARALSASAASLR
jgi:glycosyltransferase involved in cell wall biosynthesis